MKICNAVGTGVCVNCDKTPPVINGYSYGDVCRFKVQEVMDILDCGNMVCYSHNNNKFYEKVMFVSPESYMDNDWEEI